MTRSRQAARAVLVAMMLPRAGHRRCLIDGIVDADTVVLEVYQLYTPDLSLTQPAFLAQLRRALR